MGNSLGSKKTAKIMKITGESFKMQTPVRAGTVVKDFPGHVLLESESVKHFGIRAKPLDPNQNLESKRLYFMVELPRTWKERAPRRVRSGIQMSAKERLENLKLSRRSSSDLSVMKNKEVDEEEREVMTSVKLRLPKWKVEKLRKESESGSDFSDKITALCLLNIQRQRLLHNGGRSFGIGDEEGCVKAQEVINSF
ncbi:hypothetical protein HID58_072994 [Brassica napus]|uniref:(rape) hypothetical protein n=1 Tax=Brassica napus TaxID=3708 RepID=A0A816QMQ2_BRANA|nr:uncharacterized protein At1g66480 [Brassica napus]KAH0875632.1 hypothetical protein HID58_072994 [Brassica napus]CAF2063966.1 unnamed protein product [Brassica napus]